MSIQNQTIGYKIYVKISLYLLYEGIHDTVIMSENTENTDTDKNLI